MRLFGLIGFPLTHSFSKTYFDRKFGSDAGLFGCSYENFEIRDINLLPGLIKQHPDLEGFNVTRPYKESVISYLDYIDDRARLAGAVNTVRISRNPGGSKPILSGFNTDIAGFAGSLASWLQNRKVKAIVLGTGGASKAVVLALLEAGIEWITAGRHKGKGDITYGDLNESLLHEYRLIVNATPLGTYPDIAGLPPLPYDHIGAGHFLFDLVYNPPVTAFMKEGLKRGACVRNGLEMLRLQAEAAWQIWNQVA